MLQAIVDAGHGFFTLGKESIYHNDKYGYVQLKENEVNEAVVNKLSILGWLNGLPIHFISNEWRDISLSERCRRERVIQAGLSEEGIKSIFISIHADAFHQKDKAHGGRFFYYSEEGKKLAYSATEYLRNNGYQLKLREPLKRNFQVLRQTNSPAILFELGFMTSTKDLQLLKSDEFRNKTAYLIFKWISSLNSNNL